ncbi:hypothetical protein CPAR01_03563 [Colletotrichum paranaense]|uniref:Uncharacterized protein n=2 Tax=Colletotrichum acutatum species complex TaxID=2707335 RepID=A0A9Q8WIH9_9PEZI|nr:uncharacterized protein CLUP02_10150 [Colletotrichum lupini]XP_060352056.1 uncharacterized protein CPAR01_03563 [Colletotrichum paranaense]XP_060398061.1 uncharacterized protein CABS01_01492 [Colletotrichum abscissum]KAK1495685.1 hypothetical protein CABS01_01492 [Colletotrichum abscissum]KAK1542930.1 hypothetical protein CPAR01_03563 [Colletotrichum paranaense]UQC84654.1 hypothetical protein CLUP02_10150 [Colletotrichum lupini]
MVDNQALHHDEAALDRDFRSPGLSGFQAHRTPPSPSPGPPGNDAIIPLPIAARGTVGGGSEHKSDADLVHQGKRKEIGRSDKGRVSFYSAVLLSRPAERENSNGGPIHLQREQDAMPLLC